jgi:hypothetical protein
MLQLMSKGLFPRFLKVLRREWATALPNIEPVATTLSPLMPKSSTFRVRLDAPAEGVASHLFLQFQHNSKAWAVGQFTINVVASSRAGAPTRDIRKPSAFHHGSEGYYRIGGLTHGPDKWWALAPRVLLKESVRPSHVRVQTSTGETMIWPTARRASIMVWRPSSYDNEDTVFAEILADVTADVRMVLSQAAKRRAVTLG